MFAKLINRFWENSATGNSNIRFGSMKNNSCISKNLTDTDTKGQQKLPRVMQVK